MTKIRMLLALCSFAVLSTGCPREFPVFTCPNRDVFCDVTPGGLCVTANDGISYCSYPNKDCPSGYHWGVNVAPELEGKCTDAALIEAHKRRDMGADAAAMDASMSDG
jgi:hypothetical protein